MSAQITLQMMQALQELEAQYQMLSATFGQLESEEAFESPNQREQMAEAVKVTMMNWVRAKNRILGESAATVKTLRTEVAKAQKEINESLKTIQNIKAKLNTITKAVNTVASIVATLT
jgi:hypothetical protein